VSTKTGRAGEFLAAYILETFGVEVHHAARDGADLWCKVQGSLVTVQVKAASKPVNYKKRPGDHAYRFYCPPVDVGWYCFIALDKQLLLMRLPAEVLAQTIRIKPREFNEANQRRTIEEFLESC